jgi:hypothetical protein
MATNHEVGSSNLSGRATSNENAPRMGHFHLIGTPFEIENSRISPEVRNREFDKIAGSNFGQR